MTQPTRRLYKSSKWLAEVNEPDQVEDNTANPDQDPEASANSEQAPVMSPEENSYKNRYDALKGHYDRTVNELRLQIKGLQDQVKTSASDTLELPATEDELKEWRKAYPDLYRVVKMISRLEANETTKSLEEQVKQVNEKSRKADRDTAYATLLRTHKDFPELSQSKEFRTWLDDQPEQIQNWLYDSDDPLLAAKAVSMYKLEVGLTKKQPKEKLEDAAMSTGRTRAGAQPDPDSGKKKEWRASEVNKLTPHQYAKVEDEIDAAIAEGRFINDM